MAEEFQSKFVLPKKLPPYLNEFVGFMESKKNIDNQTATVFLEAVTSTWPTYSQTTRIRKPREKKEPPALPPPTQELLPEPMQQQQQQHQQCFNHEAIVAQSRRLKLYIYGNVADERVRNDLLGMVDDLFVTPQTG